MAAPNANPSNCGGVSVTCCPNRVPEVLKASFSGANTCGFNADAYLVWDGTSWSVSGVGCQGGFTIGLACALTWGAASLTISGNAGNCNYSITGLTATCDGPDGFKLVYTVKQNTPVCACCGPGTTFTMTLTN